MNLTHNLDNKKLVIALSGGVDSIVLTHFIRSNINYQNIRAVHINHNLSLNAKYWQSFCQSFCQKIEIKLDIFSLKLDKLNNLEHQAREDRYKLLFNNLKSDEILLTAHHKNDQAETVLLNLFRGSTPLGLSAMPRVKNNHYRPFLDTNKSWIVQYAKEHNLEFISDESNNNNHFRRNFIRNEVLPLIKNKYPNAINSLNKAAKGQQDSLKLADDLARIDIKKYNLTKDNLLNINNLKKLEQHRVLNIIYFHLRNLGFKLPNSKIANQIYQAIFSKNDSKVLIKWAEFEVRKFNSFLYFLTMNNELEFCPFYEELKDKKRFNIKYRKGGERIKFENKNHSQKLKKVLQDKKIPFWQRDKLRMYYLGNKLTAIEKIGYCTLK